MILECQQEGSWGIDRKWDLWSVSKSVLHAVVGVSVGLYGLNLDEPYQGLRARDLLEFRSGLQWRESYEWNPLRSSIIEALFDPTRDRSLPDFVLGHGQGTAKKARYSSGDSILLAEWLRSKGVTSSRIERDIFPRLGLSELELETDSRGLWMASSFTYGTINTLKNFGELYLGKGRQVGKGLDPAWVDALWEQQFHSEPGWALLPHWWSFKGRSSGHAQDWLVASGHWGQAVFLSRSQDLLIVRFGNDRFRRFDWDVFLDELAQVTRTHDR
jgi:CubicO group peptidase (beta-lactamase class C family)